MVIISPFYATLSVHCALEKTGKSMPSMLMLVAYYSTVSLVVVVAAELTFGRLNDFRFCPLVVVTGTC